MESDEDGSYTWGFGGHDYLSLVSDTTLESLKG